MLDTLTLHAFLPQLRRGQRQFSDHIGCLARHSLTFPPIQRRPVPRQWGSTGTVKWNIGTVPGLQNTAGGGTNKSSTMGAVTLVVQVNPAAANGRICNTAQIYVGSTLHWTTNAYPNEISMVFKRNCVDIVLRGLTIAKSANPTLVNPNGTSTFSIVVTSLSGANYWLNGGRPKVYPGFSAVTESYGYIGFFSQLRSEAYEPLINPTNYRWSFFFYDPTYGTPYGASGLPITQQTNLIMATHNINTSGSSGGCTVADFEIPQIPMYNGVTDSLAEMPVVAGTDATYGAWNQRYVFRWFDTPVTSPHFPTYYGSTAGIPNLWYVQRQSGNVGGNMQYGDLSSNIPVLNFDVWPANNVDNMRPATMWAGGPIAVKAWSWMGGGYAPATFSGDGPYPLPVSPHGLRATGPAWR